MPKGLSAPFSKLKDGLTRSASAVGPMRMGHGQGQGQGNTVKKSRSDASLEALREQPPSRADYSMRVRIGARAAQFFISILQITVLLRLDVVFLTQRDFNSTFAAAVWMAYLTLAFTVAAVGIHYHPKVIKGKWSPSRPLAIEIGLSLVMALLHLGVFLASAINSGSSDNAQKASCLPGTQNGKCDMMNMSILFSFLQTCSWGFMIYRCIRDIYKYGGGSGEFISISQLRSRVGRR
ncbi:hypothetical protein BCR44DRAFT_63218 [Catenaria anguillulae PL171]|uniref:MARVEL domain-containing protein n=1 Tax=Catenaria anguillulae PL171 TaxID=765915 RepID=A0A1Y2HXM3_9FUNG|nr:hypothetical protein BCR44DRAFT_63218 [Catenaria anguillulae PL171]